MYPVTLKYVAAHLALLVLAQAGTPVLTRSYDNGRTGANVSETVLTPQLVGARGLKKIKSLKIDDDPRIEAQPLYAPDLEMADGKKHNVVFVASMGNHVWAFDADERNERRHVLWKSKQLGRPFRPPETRAPGLGRSTPIDLYGINIHWGILSTPVIDLEAKTMYVVNWMVGTDGQPALFAHCLRLKDGMEVGSPVPIRARLLDDHGQVVMDANHRPVELYPNQKQRAALLLVPLRGEHKTLFVATSGGEIPCAPHGWIVAIDVDSFTQTAAWVSTPMSFGGGIWQASQGLSADDEGNVYALTGNGGYNTETCPTPNDPKPDVTEDFNGKTDFAEAFVKLKYEKFGTGGGKLTLIDWFIPFRDVDRRTDDNYDYQDQDLGSGAPVLPPQTSLLLGAGKDGLLYVLDRGNLGKKVGDLSGLKSPPVYITFNGVGLPSSGAPIDFTLGDDTRHPSKTHHLHGSPVYWDGANGPMIFSWGENESLRAWRINPITGEVSFVGKGAEIASGKLAAETSGIGGMPGGMLTLSSNGKLPNTGIIWALAPIDGDANSDVVDGVARAYDATRLDDAPIDASTPRLKLLWDSNRSHVRFRYSKFCTPVVTDGKLLVPTYNGRVDVYMLNQ
jgi:outer membrane protein assembly factor BamB